MFNSESNNIIYIYSNIMNVYVHFVPPREQQERWHGDSLGEAWNPL
jgi:hypothetical protein